MTQAKRGRGRKPSTTNNKVTRVKQDYTIDLEVLRDLVGEEITYRELCEALGWKPSNGNTKQAQFKALDKVCEYTEEKQSGKPTLYTITKIKLGLDIDFIKQELSNRKLVNLVAKSILEQLYLELKGYQKEEHNDYILKAWFITKSKLLRKVGLINGSYIGANVSLKKFSERYGLDVEQVIDCFNLNRQAIDKTLRKALDLLANNYHVITWTSKAYILKVKVIEDVCNSDILQREVEEEIFPSLKVIEWINNTAIKEALKRTTIEYKDFRGITRTRSLKDIEDLYKASGEVKQQFYNDILPQTIRELSVLKRNDKFIYCEEIQQLAQTTQVSFCYRIGFNEEIIKGEFDSKDNFLVLKEEEKEQLDSLFTELNLLELNLLTDSNSKYIATDTTEEIHDLNTQRLVENGNSRHYKARLQLLELSGEESVIVNQQGAIITRAKETYKDTNKQVAIQLHGKNGEYYSDLFKTKSKPNEYIAKK